MLYHIQQLEESIDKIVGEMLKVKVSSKEWDELSREYISLNVKMYCEDVRKRVIQCQFNQYNNRR